IIPTRRFLFLVVLGTPLTLFPIIGLPFDFFWVLILWLSIFGFSFLAVLLARMQMKSIDFQVEMEPLHFVGEPSQWIIHLSSHLSGTILGRLYLLLPQEFQVHPEPVLLEIKDNLKIQVEVLPLKRGNFEFHGIRLRIQDPLQLWEIESTLPQVKNLEVIPNIRGVGKTALSFYQNHKLLAGIKVEKMRGEGSEFDSLREYTPGYDIRKMDWKASARKGKLVCREFRTEQNHDIILALDSGHLMASEFQGLTKLDYAINSLLLLGYTAIWSGDRIGFLSFDSQVHSFMKPLNKPYQIHAICRFCAGLSYQFTPTNYVVAFDHLMAHQKKRALIILFTDFVDTLSSQMLQECLAVISRKHKVLFVAIRDPFLDEFTTKTATNLQNLHKQVACYQLKEERKLLFEELKRMGIFCLDLFPNQISVPVINKYLEIRNKELI
ncbi:MAG: DUF58 domain-containing protein, partial [Planctomycetota bacterium]